MDSIFPVCFLPLSGLVRSGLFRGVERMKGWSGNYGGKNYGSMRIVGRDMGMSVSMFEIKSELRIRFSIPIVEQVVEQVVIGIRKYCEVLCACIFLRSLSTFKGLKSLEINKY